MFDVGSYLAHTYVYGIKQSSGHRPQGLDWVLLLPTVVLLSMGGDTLLLFCFLLELYIEGNHLEASSLVLRTLQQAKTSLGFFFDVKSASGCPYRASPGFPSIGGAGALVVCCHPHGCCAEQCPAGACQLCWASTLWLVCMSQFKSHVFPTIMCVPENKDKTPLLGLGCVPVQGARSWWSCCVQASSTNTLYSGCATSA